MYWLISLQTQGLLCDMESRWQTRCQRQGGQNRQTCLGDVDWHLSVDVWFFFQFCRLIFFPWLSCIVCWLVSSQTQGLLGDMETRRSIFSQWKSDVSVSIRSLVWLDTHVVNRNQEGKTIIVITCIFFFRVSKLSTYLLVLRGLNHIRIGTGAN